VTARFNPRPPFLTGDGCTCSYDGSGTAGFNPRPPFLTGDGANNRCDGDHANVSIHARHF